jgi:thiamine-phosphate pyrophosphorylase
VSAGLRGLYVIIDPAACRGRAVLEVARAALEGGATTLQWRDKAREKGPQLRDLGPLAALCRERNTPLIVNDHADLALAAHADGVHVGQLDLPVAAVRRIVGAGMIVGCSTNDADEARTAEHDGATYVAIGDIFGTTSKTATRPASLDRLRAVKAATSLPVVAIGGINGGNIASVIAAGADAAAVIGAVCAADDPRSAAQALSAAFARVR